MRASCRFTGRVQGVGFRATARRIAAGYRVTGWVCNEADGSVSLEVQGEPGEVSAFLDSLRRTMGGNIHSEDTREVPVLRPELESGFVVRR